MGYCWVIFRKKFLSIFYSIFTCLAMLSFKKKENIGQGFSRWEQGKGFVARVSRSSTALGFDVVSSRRFAL